jgi:hypothetical protein
MAHVGFIEEGLAAVHKSFQVRNPVPVATAFAAHTVDE